MAQQEHMVGLEGQTPTKTSAATPPADLRASRLLNAMYFGLLGAMAAALVVWGIVMLRDRLAAQRLAALYDAQCPALSSDVRETPTCHRLVVQVADHFTATVGNVTAYGLTLQRPDGRPVPSRTGVDRDTWNAVANGTHIDAQVWKGTVTAVFIGEHVVETADNPDSKRDTDSVYLVVDGVLMALAATGLLLPLFNATCAKAAFKRSVVVAFFTFGTPALLKALT